jgi:hypothetical protein
MPDEAIPICTARTNALRCSIHELAARAATLEEAWAALKHLVEPTEPDDDHEETDSHRSVPAMSAAEGANKTQFALDFE